MNKAVLALVVAGTLVGGSTASFAADKTPMAKPTAAAEGTAKHEAAESKSTQKKEAMASAKPKAMTGTKKSSKDMGKTTKK